MNVRRLTCLLVLVASLAYGTDQYKMNPHTGKLDNVGEFVSGQYSSARKVGTGIGNAPTWNGGAWPGGSGSAHTIQTSTGFNLPQRSVFQCYSGLTCSDNGVKTQIRPTRISSIAVDDFNPTADGTIHTLSSLGYLLSTAQNKWPHAGIADVNSQTADWAAIKEALFWGGVYGADVLLGAKSYYVTAGIDWTTSVNLRGHSAMDSIVYTNYSSGATFNSHKAFNKISNFRVQYGPATQPRKQQIAVQLGDDVTADCNVGWEGTGRYSLISDMMFWGNGTGVRVASACNSRITGNIFRGSLAQYGIVAENFGNPDQGDIGITDNQFAIANSRTDTTASVYIDRNSGFRITSNKFIGLPKHQVFINMSSTSSNVISLVNVTGNSFEAGKNSHLKIINKTPSAWYNYTVAGNEFNMFHDLDNTGATHYPVIDMSNIIAYNITGNVLSNGVPTGGLAAGDSGIKLRNATNGFVGGNTFRSAYAGIDVDSTVTYTTIGVNQYYSDVATKLVGTPSSTLDNYAMLSGANNTLTWTTSGNNQPRILLSNTDAGLNGIYPNLDMRVFSGEASSRGMFLSDRFRGNSATPTAVQSGDYLGTWQAWGMGTTAAKLGGQIDWQTTGAFTDADQPSKLLISVGKIGGNNAVDLVATLDGTGVTLPAGKKYYGDGSSLTGLSLDPSKHVISRTIGASSQVLSTDDYVVFNGSGVSNYLLYTGYSNGSVVGKTIVLVNISATVNLSLGAGDANFIYTGASSVAPGQMAFLTHISNGGGSIENWTGMVTVAPADLSTAVLLAGRVTPQTIAFGTSASATGGYLTSTSNATKGSYNLTAAGTITVDEVNTRIGIGTSTPHQALDIHGAPARVVGSAADQGWQAFYANGATAPTAGTRIGYLGIGAEDSTGAAKFGGFFQGEASENWNYGVAQGTDLVFKSNANGQVTTWNERARMPQDGGFRLASATKPTCDAAHRGTSFYVAGASLAKDTYEICAKDAADAYAWRTIY